MKEKHAFDADYKFKYCDTELKTFSTWRTNDLIKTSVQERSTSQKFSYCYNIFKKHFASKVTLHKIYGKKTSRFAQTMAR